MRHFEEQNASFWSVKWLILKNGMIFRAVLFDSFTISKAFVSLE